jgi:hypothetical protein
MGARATGATRPKVEDGVIQQAQIGAWQRTTAVSATLAGIIGWLLVAGTAHAEEGTAFRLSLSGPVVSTVSAKGNVDGIAFTLDSTAAGLLSDGVLIGLGVAPNRTVNFGLDFSSRSQTQQLEFEGATNVAEQSSYVLAPYIEAGFSDHGLTRPYVRGQLSLISSTTTTESPDAVVTSELKDTFSTLRLAAGVGVQFFLLEQLSLDTRLDLVHVSVTRSGDFVAEPQEGSGVGIVVGAGLSGWFGRQSSEPASSPSNVSDPAATDLGGPAPPETQEAEPKKPREVIGGNVHQTADGSLSLTLGQNVLLRIDAPEEGSETVNVIFLVPESVAGAADCSAARAFYQGEEVEVELAASKLQRGSEELTVVQGELPRSLLSRVAKKAKTEPSGFVVCESRLELTGRQREVTRGLLRKKK